MIAFKIEDMTCGHCVAAITKAVQAVDPAAKVDIDLAAHQVRIDPRAGGAAQFDAAIRDAGYTPQALTVASGPGSASASTAAPAR